jgi:hypothetical protein
MRVGYVYPTPDEFLILFSKADKIRGGNLSDIQTFQSPVYFQRGSGIFSVISGLVRRTLPFLRRVILPAVANMGRDMALDFAEKRDMKKSVKERGIIAVKRIGEKIIRGGVKKRRKNRKKKRVKVARKSSVIKKRRATTCHPPDIFDKYQ